MKPANAEEFWMNVVQAVRVDGDVPLHRAIEWTPALLAEAWKATPWDEQAQVLVNLFLNYVVAMALMRRVVADAGGDVSRASALLDSLEQAVTSPGTIYATSAHLQVLRDQTINKLLDSRSHDYTLREAMQEFAHSYETQYSQTLALNRIVRVIAGNSDVKCKGLLRPFVPTLEDIVAAAQRVQASRAFR
jgi:hypothetical protein